MFHTIAAAITSSFHRLASPTWFYRIANILIPISAILSISLICCGLYWGLYKAPTDYQQGDAFRIIYLHVPSAWMSLFLYINAAICGSVLLIWRIKLAGIAMHALAICGTAFTIITLVTGSIWGKPMWGTWWVWDARLTSELILLFIYLGIIALYNAGSNRESGAKMASLLAIIGLINIPIIHYSVIWWASLHQGPTISKFDTPSIHIDMLLPLLLTAFGFMLYALWVVLLRMRNELLVRDKKRKWVQAVHEAK